MGATAIAAFLADVGPEPDAEAIARAFAQHLAKITAAGLAPTSQVHWREVARLVKVSAAKPIGTNAIAAIRSWPAARTAALLAHICALHADLERIENERWEDEIRDKVRHSYL